MNNFVARKNTIIIDCHELGFRPKTHIVHELLVEQFKLNPLEVEAVELCPYKKAIFLKVQSSEIVHRVLNTCQGKFVYKDEGIYQELSVQEEESAKVKLTMSTVPLEITDA